MKLCVIISGLPEINTYTNQIPPDTPEKKTIPPPMVGVINIIYHIIRNMSKTKMIEQGFNYVNSTYKELMGFFEIRVENLEPRVGKKRYPLLEGQEKSKESKKSKK